MSERGMQSDGPATRAEPVRSDGQTPTCECGHAEAAHRHYRRGSDCGVCGAMTCARFRRQGRMGARLRDVLRRGRG